MEVNELLGRFEKVKNSAPRYSARKGIGLSILKVRFEERIKNPSLHRNEGLYICGFVIAGKSKLTLLLYDDLSCGNFIFAQFPVRVFQVDVFTSYDGQTFVRLAEKVAVLLAISGVCLYCIFKNRSFHIITYLGSRNIAIFFAISDF